MATEQTEETLQPQDLDDKNWRGGHAKYVKEHGRERQGKREHQQGKEHEQGKQASATQQPQQQAHGSDVQRQKATKAGIAAAYGAIATVTAILGVAMLFFTPQVAHQAFGPAVLEPKASVAKTVKEAVDQVQKGKAPDVTKGALLDTRGRGLDLLYDVQLRIIGSAILGASLAAYLLRRAAQADLLNNDTYKRLNLGLVAWAAASIALSALKYQLFRPPALLVWLVALVNVLAATGPLAMKQGPANVLGKTVDDLRNVRTTRGWLFVLYSVLFFGEGILLLLFPAATLKAATTRDGGEIGHLLWQLVAASAHIIVPVAAFNLKSAADRHQLTTLSSFIQDAILGIVALVHVFVLTRATTAGMAGPLGPVLMLAWSSALIYSLYNVPHAIEGTP